MIQAKIICDSKSAETGVRLTTLQLVYPRFIHSEFMTHRVFSRNASSSRAIPVSKMLEQVRTNPAMPIHWGKNQPGMQANEELNTKVNIGWTPDDFVSPKDAWRIAAENAAFIAERLSEAGYHKQIVNRILEPFQFIHVVVTATEWDNFFTLRDHPDAQPEIQELAKCIKEAMQESSPIIRYADSKVFENWHLPYINEGEFYDPILAAKCSAARCARVSYIKHDGNKPSIEEDLTLYNRLVGSNPIHASPVEHQAFPSKIEKFYGNFNSWVQFRKILNLIHKAE